MEHVDALFVTLPNVSSILKQQLDQLDVAMETSEMHRVKSFL